MVLLTMLVSFFANATGQQIDNLTITKIRSVGNFHVGSIYDDSIELWFSTSLVWAESMNCTVGYRVYIDASKTHMVSAAFLAYASGKTVNVYADDTLPLRSGSCEISYIDINK